MEALNPTITPKPCLPRTSFLKSHLFNSTFKPTFCPHNSQFFKRTPLSLSVTCTLKTPQENKNKKSNNISKKIILSEGAPPPLEEKGGGATGGDKAPTKSGSGVMGSMKRLPRKILSALSYLPLAIGEMFVIAGLMALGTFIDQGEAPDHYFDKYPESNPILGIFTWRWVLALGFDHMYSSPIFLATLALLAASLMACTYTTQIPLVKVARRWSFLQSSEAIQKQEFSEALPRASVQDLGVILMGAGYEVSQFYTDLSLMDLDGKEVLRKTISVNNPLRYGGITIYQTDWSISALQLIKDNEGPFNLAVAPLQINGDKKLYGTFLPVGDVDAPNVKGISMLLRDLQSIVLYDQEGKFVGVRRPSSKLPIEIDGSKITIVDAIGSSGLALKTDPGVPVVYAGFGALMLTTCISFLSHSQIWALQDGTAVVVGGKTNRAKGEFPEEMNRLLDRVPELIDSSLSKQSDSTSG
ncbi:cytochrome c biogenesis protein CCS1, chloroplastic isoform X3 [Rosa chinensis]|uniref:cytochrome c biogenesis protein CCS1, chloroplastic isoform X3 n=1 Tax=Rosa chinensis TaxID=74649 RepID=UPI001AD8FA29|nr:cytochrome c biogenesis protein CCS1, chloroplastic isoform X3 [Rosa chinensis]